ncbi:iron chelate uptake ABC transporter family permease subunit [Acholeplasma granularum]|uniref:iron chelate uptake ABC transporter family permease subunit n=1 Tax=Acholeplasma granularum TaxID=264635 RepID=UPI00138AB291|nr:iron chelate uptake ABC transporter family permease subunit [Acholeplasma granularum]
MRKKIIIWSILSILSIILYLFVWMISQYDLIIFSLNDPDRRQIFMQTILTIFQRRTIQIIGLLIAATLTATTTLTFQTLTKNRIITPNLLGFDSIYIVIQTTLVYFFSISKILQDPTLNFILSVVIMTGVTLLMYKLVLNKNKNNILLLLLVGMVISTLTSNYSSFLKILMDPQSFQTVESLTSVSVVNMDTTLIVIALPISLIISLIFYFKSRVYDVLALGESYAINLGINYSKETYLNLILISFGVSIVTALVGPLAFLGLIAVNIAKETYEKYHHKIIYFISILVSITVLIMGQAVVELLGFETLVTTIMSLFGGFYMIYLIIKEHKI